MLQPVVGFAMSQGQLLPATPADPSARLLSRLPSSWLRRALAASPVQFTIPRERIQQQGHGDRSPPSVCETHHPTGRRASAGARSPGLGERPRHDGAECAVRSLPSCAALRDISPLHSGASRHGSSGPQCAPLRNGAVLGRERQAVFRALSSDDGQAFAGPCSAAKSCLNSLSRTEWQNLWRSVLSLPK